MRTVSQVRDACIVPVGCSTVGQENATNLISPDGDGNRWKSSNHANLSSSSTMYEVRHDETQGGVGSSMRERQNHSEGDECWRVLAINTVPIEVCVYDGLISED